MTRVRGIFTLVLVQTCLAHGSTQVFLKDITAVKEQSAVIRARASKREALALAAQTKRLFWTPSISMGLGRTTGELPDLGTKTSSDYWQAQASLNLFKGGRDLDLMRAAEARFEAEQISQLKVELQVEFLATELIFKSIFLVQSLAEQNEILKLKDEALRVTKERYSQGKLPLEEVVKSEVDLSQHRAQIRSIRLEQAELDSKIRIVGLEKFETQDWPFDEAIKIKSDSETTTTLDESQKKWVLEVSKQEHRALKSSYWPELNFVSHYQVSRAMGSEQRQITNSLSLTFNLWDGYQTKSQVAALRAAEQLAEYDYQDGLREAKAKEVLLAERLKIAKENLTDAKVIESKSRKLYSDYMRTFKLGRLSINDLLAEQTRLLASQAALTEGYMSFHRVVVETCLYKGKPLSECLSLR